MYCCKHPKTYSATTCGSCGVGICKHCVDNSFYTFDNRPLCYDCNLKAAEDEIGTFGRKKVWAMIKCIFVLVFMILGLCIWQSTGDVMNAWIYAGIGGIPSAFKSTSSTSVRVINGDIIDTLFYPVMFFLIRLIIIIALAPITAFFLVIINLVAYFKSSGAQKKAKDAYEFLRANPEASSAVPASPMPNGIEDIDDDDDRWMKPLSGTSTSKPSIPKLNFKRPSTS